MKTKHNPSGEMVAIHHIGFDLIWIIFDNGDEKLVEPEECGLEQRKRPNASFIYLIQFLQK